VRNGYVTGSPTFPRTTCLLFVHFPPHLPEGVPEIHRTQVSTRNREKRKEREKERKKKKKKKRPREKRKESERKEEKKRERKRRKKEKAISAQKRVREKETENGEIEKRARNHTPPTNSGVSPHHLLFFPPHHPQILTRTLSSVFF